MKKKNITLETKQGYATEAEYSILADNLLYYEILDLLKFDSEDFFVDAELIELTIEVFGKTYQMEIVQNELRTYDYQRAIDGNIFQTKLDPCQTFRGKVKGTEGEVRFSIFKNGISGFFQLEDQKIFLERPLKLKLQDRELSTIIAYYEKDAIVESGSYCGVTTEHERKYVEWISKTLQNNLESESCKFLKIATDADYAFYQIYGSSTNAEILNIINIVEGLYVSAFNVYLRISFQNIWTSNDPYTGDPLTPTGAELLVSELRDYWNSNFTHVIRDVVHLFTGVNPYVGGVAGRVYDIGTICVSPKDSYGFSREMFLIFLVTAHEFGHNFGGIHSDGENCGPYIGSVMCPSLGEVPMYFSAASTTRISNFINSNGNCLSPSLYFKIVGSITICTAEVYSVSGLLLTDTVIWNVTPSNAATIISNGHSCTVHRQSGFNGPIILSAAIASICGPLILTKALQIGILNGASVDGFTSVPLHQLTLYMVQGLNVPLSEVIMFSWFVIPQNGGGGGITAVSPGIANAWFDTEGEYLLGVNIFNACGYYETPTLSVYVHS